MDKILSVLGLSSTAMLGWYALAFLLAMGGAALVGGYFVHDYDVAKFNGAIAAQNAKASELLAFKTAEALAQERANRETTEKLEEANAKRADDRAQHQVEGARLSADLDAALERLRRIGAGRTGGGSTPGRAGRDAGVCPELSAARDRAVAALELLERAGDQAALDGQRAVDIATTAAEAARAQGGADE